MLLQSIKVTPLAPTFGATVSGVDFSRPLQDHEFQTLKDAMEEYGVVVLRNTSFDDASLIEFGRRFGKCDLSTIHKDPNKPVRVPIPEIFDVSNLDENDQIYTEANPRRMAIANANAVWHADGHYNPLRTSWSMLRAVEIPPRGEGGETEYLDGRTAYDDLSPEMKEKIDKLVGMNSMISRMRYANRNVEPYESMDPMDHPFAKHKVASVHGPTGRRNLYVSYYTDHIEGMPREEGQALLTELLEHLKQDKYKLAVHWENPGDVTIWDNTAVLHRATQGEFTKKYRRDMRRVSILDKSTEAFGLNSKDDLWRQGAP